MTSQIVAGKRRVPRWVWNVVRIAVSLGILAFIVARMPFVDRTWTVIEKGQDNQITLRDAAGQQKTVTLRHFDTPVGGQWIEPGFGTVCRRINVGWLAGAFAVFWLAPALQALRWRRLLHVQNVHLSIGTVLQLMWVGLFFNLFLLGAVGGDLIKAYYVSHHSPQTRAESVITVLVDRIIGLLGLVWLSALAMLICLAVGYPIEGGLPWLWLTPGAVVLVGGLVFYSSRLRNVLGVNRLVSKLPETHMVRRLDRAVYTYRRHKALVGEAFVWTLLSHICLLLTIHFVLRSLGINAIGTVFICAPLILVATGIIPSIGGLGIQEGGFVLFFAPLLAGGEGTAVALAASLAYRLVTIATSLPGAGVLMLGSHLPSRAQMQAEMQEA